MQLNLALLEIPSPTLAVWAQLDEELRAAVLAILARLLAQAAAPQASTETNNHD